MGKFNSTPWRSDQDFGPDQVGVLPFGPKVPRTLLSVTSEMIRSRIPRRRSPIRVDSADDGSGYGRTDRYSAPLVFSLHHSHRRKWPPSEQEMNTARLRCGQPSSQQTLRRLNGFATDRGSPTQPGSPPTVPQDIGRGAAPGVVQHADVDPTFVCGPVGSCAIRCLSSTCRQAGPMTQRTDVVGRAQMGTCTPGRDTSDWAARSTSTSAGRPQHRDAGETMAFSFRLG